MSFLVVNNLILYSQNCKIELRENYFVFNGIVIFIIALPLFNGDYKH